MVSLYITEETPLDEIEEALRGESGIVFERDGDVLTFWLMSWDGFRVTVEIEGGVYPTLSIKSGGVKSYVRGGVILESEYKGGKVQHLLFWYDKDMVCLGGVHSLPL